GVPSLADLRLALIACLGIWLVAGAAAVFNCLVEKGIDAKMRRTAWRATAKGELSDWQTMSFAAVLCALGSWLLYVWVNPLTMWLTFATFVGYAVIYTVILKPLTPQNIVIGGASGAMPPVLGWAAMTGDVGPEALILFLIIFLWTPPHFWALALVKSADYARAGIPMLPNVAGPAATRRQILLYTLVLAPVGVVPVTAGFAGLAYAVVSVLGGLAMLALALKVYRVREGEPAMRAAQQLFGFSILYLFLLFAALLAEHGLGLLRPLGLPA
ncbi:MAG: heme o synthase, partial [Microvirga sp.]